MYLKFERFFVFAFNTFAVIIVVVELLELLEFKLIGFRSVSLLGLQGHIDRDCNLYTSCNFKPFLKNGLCVFMCLCVCVCMCVCVCVCVCVCDVFL